MSEQTRKPALHELLAVEPDMQSKFNVIVKESIATFTKKAEHFNGSIKTYTPYDELEKDLTSTEDRHDIVTTVPAKLAYIAKHGSNYIDVVLQKEKANQEAVADLVVNGSVIAEKLPATFLLGLENKLKNIRDMYLNLPTLDPKITWVADVNKGDGFFMSQHDDISIRTKKLEEFIEAAPPTKEHPAQIVRVSKDVPVGKSVTKRFSGMISSAEKSKILEKIDALIMGTKKARMRANQVEVNKASIGSKIFKFINLE